MDGGPLQNLWHELRQEIAGKRSLASEVELRMTGLMTSPSFELAISKLGRYLHEASLLREKNQFAEALVGILVGAEYYWRKHFLTRAAGLLLEAGDLFYLLNNKSASLRCLMGAYSFSLKQPSMTWWENEIFGNTVLLIIILTLMENPLMVSSRLRELRQSLTKKEYSRLSRQDGYRVAITIRRAIRKRVFTPIDILDLKSTIRSSSEYATLHEYLMALAERYALVRDGLTALRQYIQQGDR